MVGFCHRSRGKNGSLDNTVTAALGAGVVTSFAVSRGQNPLVALAITVFAAGVALICDRFGLI
ncbi:MAG: hypothetical protein JGK29_30005 [Microcoleus sp. PH2017_17_BER_D_A]|nr:hypothetical protein [Microcoleus sp. PH2017_17_BER_D_A]